MIMNKEEILYQIVAVDSELKKGFPDEITTILKNGITGKTYTDYDFKNHRYLYCFINDNFNIYDRLEEKDKEIERLTAESTEWESKCYKYQDIINELEKWLEDQWLEWKDCETDVRFMANEDKAILDKLKELKEGGKE